MTLEQARDRYYETEDSIFDTLDVDVILEEHLNEFIRNTSDEFGELIRHEDIDMAYGMLEDLAEAQSYEYIHDNEYVQVEIRDNIKQYIMENIDIE